jgi:hypothetical protein
MLTKGYFQSYMQERLKPQFSQHLKKVKHSETYLGCLPLGCKGSIILLNLEQICQKLIFRLTGLTRPSNWF